MTEQEQIEVWRKEFELKVGDENTKKNGEAFNVVGYSHLSPKKGSYRLPSIESMWQGFLMAKRSQPVVVLQKPEMCFGKPPFAYVRLDPLIERLAAAGVQFKVED